MEVTAADVFDFLAHQRGERHVVRLADRESGLSARTIARRYAGRSTTCAHTAEASCRNCGDHVENPVSVLVDGLQRATCSVAVAIVGLSAAGMGHVGVPPRLDTARTAG